ncbi:MAG: nucleotidyltransferase [Pseudomonadota bacterium]
MPISETQLETWSHQGATTTSATTHKSVRTALEAHRWPAGMSYEAYLQGSYPNATNIRGNSDVDLVVQTNGIFYNNLSDNEKSALKLSDGKYSLADFRAEVIEALTDYYGSDLVDDTGDNCLKLLPKNSRLPADVVPCAKYKRYKDLGVTGEGMTFWTQKSKTQVINYPKLHIKRGASKNANVSKWYKPSVRMFKNVRESAGKSASQNYPSYYLECLIYNASDDCFGNSFSDTYVSVVNFLNDARASGDLSNFVTQSGMQWLFGPEPYQWNQADAGGLIDLFIDAWNDS